MPASSLLEDLLAENHNHLLEKGNLLKKQKVWRETPKPETIGDFPRIIQTTCMNCGTLTNSLLGVYHKVRFPSGATVETLIREPIDVAIVDVEITPASAPFCLTCLELE